MTPEQRRRAGRAVADRIREMDATPTAIARAAGVHPRTVRALIRGEHWPTDAVQHSLEKVLRWRPGEIHTHSCASGSMTGFTDLQLAQELARRLQDRHKRESRLRRGDRHRNSIDPFRIESGDLVSGTGA